MKTKQHTFPQRIGKLIEAYIIDKDQLLPNKRQQTKGYYDAYNKETVFEIKAAKDDNYFRIMQKNHEELHRAHGVYILVRYSLKNVDKDLKAITDIVIGDIRYVTALELQETATTWLEDQRKKNLYYKVKI